MLPISATDDGATCGVSNVVVNAIGVVGGDVDDNIALVVCVQLRASQRHLAGTVEHSFEDSQSQP